MKRVIIAGATGMIGSIVLRHSLASDYVEEVVSISRKPTGISHPKLKEILVSDFSNLEKHSTAFENIDIGYFCLGVYTGAVADDLFKKITVDYTILFADLLKSKSPEAHFSFLSGAGADLTEQSKTSFARYKGMAENHLMGLKFDSLAIFRPAYIYPNVPRKEPNLMYTISRMLYPVIKMLGKKYSIESEQLGKAIFAAGFSPTEKQILENQDILSYLKESN